MVVMNPKTLKVFGVVFAVLLVVNMILFALRKISGLMFWGVILIVAIITFWVLPRLRGEK